MSLSSILRRGPGLQLEIMTEPSVERLAETMVAFANTDGGSILLGVDAQGQVTGALQPEDAESLLRAALAQCRPLVVTRWEQFEDRAGLAVAITVPRSTELHALADGRVLVRTHTGNEPLDGARISHLAATKASGDFEMETVAGATRADLDEEVIQDYLHRRTARVGRDLGQTEDELLTAIGALTPRGEPTVAGLLLFGKEPQFFIPQSGLIYVRFAGVEPRGPGGLPGYTRREEFGGALARMIEDCWAILLQEMRGEAVVRGLKREDRTLYPLFAVREALVNAVCHRDYRLTGRRVEIRQFDDRLEVTSPGGLPGYITLDNIVEEHFSRNPRLVNGLFEWGYIEQLGLGIDRMIEEMVQAGHPQPEFKATPYSFTVVLRRNVTAVARRAIPEWATGMNERQIRAIQYLQETGRITNREYHELCPDVSAETLRLDLNDLVEKGLLMKIGDKKGTYYILK
ncbi:MAG: ATP-binding protein [Anaerolineae bacterium]